MEKIKIKKLSEDFLLISKLKDFLKPIDKIRTDCLTRQLFDLEKMMCKEHDIAAIVDDKLFNTIVEHRKNMVSLRGID